MTNKRAFVTARKAQFAVSTLCRLPYYTTVGCLRVPEGDLGADSYR